MKLTTSKLKKIIKEELDSRPGEWGPTPTSPLNTTEDALERVMPIIEEAYSSLADDQSKAIFEEFLLKNIALYVEKWREERGEKDL